MASQSLYRKWRSQTFSDLIGQEATVRTLLNAVREGRLAHAYLFCGPRGTGKTSAARLLAKAINCANPQNGEPCNECLSCREITAGRSPDVIEIDAASNTGVDNIRDLRENVNLLGTGGHFKVYIVDECFSYGELITLADGSKEPIGKLVETQWEGEVLSYNEQTGEIEPKPIVRHMRKQASVPTVRVTFDNNRSIVCTINHKFYTPQGQVCAGHLVVGQFVYTNRERITQRHRAVVMGAALGDGHVSLTGSAMRGRLSMTHGVAQKDYLEYKVKLLGDLIQSPPRYQDGAGTYSKTGTYRASTLSRPEIAQIHRELYGDDGRKRITRAYLDQLDELGLALWYLDDGSLITANHKYERVGGGTSIYPATRSTFSMHGFSPEEARMVSAWHRERWDVESRVTVTAKGPIIWLTLAGTERLHQIIASYVPPMMEYKLLPQYRGRFQEEPVDDGSVGGLAVSVVRAIKHVPTPEYVYNIEVADNHNYFVRDMLVANCHMLTVSAFNALLKTLEEPPPHVIFVLATTEAHKVLPTIVSRCQRFDFRRFNVRTIVARLRQVAEGEGLDLEPAAADLLARAAQGGMRDALSLLDQAIAYCGTHVDLERARTMLGQADPGAVRNLIVAIADDRPADALHQLNELVVTGADLRQLQQQLGEEWRALLLARAGADVAEVMDRTADEARELVTLAGRFSLNELMACARVFARSETPARGLPVPQLALELALLECLTIRRTGGAVAQVAAATSPASPASPTSSGRAPVVAPAPAPAPRVAAMHAQPQPPQQPQPAASTRPSHVPPTSVTPVDELDLDMAERELDEMFGSAASQAPAAAVVQPSPVEGVSHDQEDALEPEAQVEPTREPIPIAAETDWLALARHEWAVIKKVCKQQSPSTAALLSHASPVRSEPGSPPVLIVEAQYEFHYEKLKAQKARDVVEWALEQVLGAPVRARFTLGGADRAGKGSNRSGTQTQASAPASGRPESQARPPSAASAASASSTSGAAMNGTAQYGAAQNGRAPQSSLNRQAGTLAATNETASRQAPAAGNGRSPNPVRLEEEAQADAIVQEIQRELGAQLLDVSPSDDEPE